MQFSASKIMSVPIRQICPHLYCEKSICRSVSNSRSFLSGRRRFSSPLAAQETTTELETGVSDVTSDLEPLESWQWESSDDSVVAYGVLIGLLLVGNTSALTDQGWSSLPYFIGLALSTIYIGAHRGLTAKMRQQISMKEGILAPVFASGLLFGAYLIIKFLPDFSLQTFLDAYFWLIGTVALSSVSAPLLRRLPPSLSTASLAVNLPKGLLLDMEGKDVTKAEFSPSDVAAVVIAVTLASAELYAGHMNYSLSNLIACVVATEILQLVGLRSFRTATLLLIGLLCYDVFWVFGSPRVIGDNVMLTVATSDMITGPTRLLFPKPPGAGMGEAADFPFSLLGLGDIAIPGLLACLSLRYDASRVVDMQSRMRAVVGAMEDALARAAPGTSAEAMGEIAADAADAAYDRVADRELAQRNRSTSLQSSSSDGASTSNSNGTLAAESSDAASQKLLVSPDVLQQRHYFKPVLGAYVVGLLMAFAANSITNLGQPALLYIVPCCLTAVGMTAASRGELGRVWQFTDVSSYGMPEEPQK